jgi:hypothetical protein
MIRKTMLLSVLVVLFAASLMAQTTAAKAADPVNVVNTPSVNVVNTPTVQLAGTSTVQVSGTTNVKVQNDSSAPVPVQDVSKPKQTPFQVNQNFGPTPFLNNNPASVTITVPAGKRLVIEHVSARAQADFGAQTPVVLFSIATTVAGARVEHFLDASQVFNFNCPSCNSPTQSHHVVSQAVKLSSDSGPTIQVIALSTSQTGVAFDINFAISGYLEDAP